MRMGIGEIKAAIVKLSNWKIWLPLSILLLPVYPLASILLPVLAIGIPMYLKEAKRRGRIARIPEIAMTISELWGLIPIHEILRRSGDEVLRAAGRLIEEGVSVKKALETAKKDAPELGELVDLILSGYKTGGQVSKMLAALAERQAAEIAINEEARVNQFIERATIAASATVVVPFVIGSMVSLTNSMAAASMLNTAPDALRQNAILGSKAYILVFASISGFYLGLTESAIKKAILYSALMAPVAWTVLQIAMHTASW